MSHRLRGGFTLIELLIAIGIVGILCAIAWPSYSSLLHRAQRNDARLALLRVQHAQERYYQRALRYSDDLGEAALATSALSDAANYQLSVTVSDEAQRYVAMARSIAGGRQAADTACALFTLDDTGRRGAENAGGEDATAACWR
ncbi:MAG: type IV pilin protein [Steroidobacteraceae bacterium]